MGHRRNNAARPLCEPLETRRLMSAENIRTWGGWGTEGDWTDASTWAEFVPAVGVVSPLITFDLRIAGGGKAAEVQNAGDVVQLELWVQIRNLDGDRTNDGFAFAHGSLLSTEADSTGVLGNLASMTFNSALVSAGLSVSGSPNNLDGHSDLELGGPDQNSPTGHIVASTGFGTRFGSGAGSGTTDFLIGTTTWTYASGITTTALNFAPRVRGTSDSVANKLVKFTSDATASTVRGDSADIGLGASVEISTPFTPPPPPQPEPDPEPEPEPDPEPQPGPDPPPDPAPQPGPEPEPEPEPQPEPHPDPDPQPEPEPAPQPAPPEVPSNNAPVAVNDVASGIAGQATLIEVVDNDSDSDAGDTLSIAIAEAPTHGTAAVINGKITYTAPAGFSGTDTFSYTLSDGNGGSATATVQVVTGASAILADPTDPQRTVLITGATTAADKISYATDKRGGILVTINGKKQGIYHPTGRIILNTGAGDDKVTLKKVNVPIYFDGGVGNDTITGTPFNDILIGGPGDDRITGGAGRDILIGGEGADRLVGGTNDDILIGGDTIYAADADAGGAALQDFLTVWTSGAGYASRVSQLAAGVGSSNVSLNSDTVTRDSAKDMLTSDTGRELIFAMLDAGAQSDAVKGIKSDETLTAI